MARPQKEGLDYFPMDVDIDQDDKLVVPIGKFGMQGFGIIVKLMGEIYKNGYFYPWGEKEQYVFASRVIVDINTIKDVVNECIKWGFFQQELFDRHSILTSKGFQKRYVEAAKRRKELTLVHDYLLIDAGAMSKECSVSIKIVNSDGNTVNVYIKPDKSNATSAESAQSKVKESKVNKSKELKPKDTTSRQIKTYAEDSSYYRMAVYLHSKINEYAKNLSVDHLIKNSNMQKWADDFRKIVELDGRQKEEIKNVIDWATKDAFWRKNILSPESLRKHYVKLCIEMTDGKGGGKLEEGNLRGIQGRGKVFGRGSGQSGALQVSDDDLDELNRQSLQMLEVSGYGNY
ncbi:DUF4373 domain-containing protein [Paenibacillus sp. TAB 01]|uniref:DUF4373 domain-containing protein n=1 Tax=Paenibacillus sp. TAB 01 TaxID=3368988 RepID=UPI00374FF299